MPKVVTTEGLEREQLVVYRRLAGAHKWQVLQVQGAAGSGKTTVALSALSEYARQRQELLEEERLTPIYVTQSPILRRECERALREHLAATSPGSQEYLSKSGQLQAGRVNLLTLEDLLSAVGQKIGLRETAMSDSECIAEVRDLLARRAHKGTTCRLLPSQVYAILTSFLKGQLAFESTASREEVEQSLDPKRHGAISQEVIWIRDFLLRDYQDRLARKKRIDRADLARFILRKLVDNDTSLHAVKALEHREVNQATQRVLLDQKPRLRKWLISHFEQVVSAGRTELAGKAGEALRQLETVKIGASAWATVKEDLLISIESLGQIGGLGSQVISEMPRPVLIIDEAQDLSEVELTTLTSLFLQLPRGKESRLAFVGDSNQQVMPSGFSWESLTEILEEKTKNYFGEEDPRFEGRYFDRIDTELENEGCEIGPYVRLAWNYRTTNEVAVFAHSMAKNAAQRLFRNRNQELRNYVARLVRDDRTLALNEDVSDYKARELERIGKSVDAELKPQVVLLSEPSLAVRGLRTYLQRYDATTGHRVVIISADPEGIEAELGDEFQELYVTSFLFCKGLEFPAVNVLGLPMSSFGIDSDILGQWYTAFTRAQVRLNLFLTPAEMNYLENEAGWPLEGGDASLLSIQSVASVLRAETAEDCARVFAGTQVELRDEEAQAREAERHLQIFGAKPSLPNLWRVKRALQAFRTLDLPEAVSSARLHAAKLLEGAGEFSAARGFYEALDGHELDMARCFAQEIRRGDSGKSLERLKAEAKAFAKRTSSLTQDRTLAADVWSVLGKPNRAFRLYLEIDATDRAERELWKIKSEEKQITAARDLGAELVGSGRQIEALQLLQRLGTACAQDVKDLLHAIDQEAQPWVQIEAYAMVGNSLSSLRDRCLFKDDFELAALCFEREGRSDEGLEQWLRACTTAHTLVRRMLGVRLLGSPSDWPRGALEEWLRGPKMAKTDLAARLPRRIAKEDVLQNKRLLQREMKTFQDSGWEPDRVAGFFAEKTTLYGGLARTMAGDRSRWELLAKATSDLSEEAQSSRSAADLLGKVERLFVDRLYALLVSRLEDAARGSSERLENACDVEHRAFQHARRLGGVDGAQLEMLRHNVLDKLWKSGSSKERLSVARVWQRLRPAWLRERIELSEIKPGTLRTSLSASGKWSEVSLPLEQWCDLVIQLHRIAFGAKLDAKSRVLQALRSWAREDDSSIAKDCAALLQKRFGEHAEGRHPASDGCDSGRRPPQVAENLKGLVEQLSIALKKAGTSGEDEGKAAAHLVSLAHFLPDQIDIARQVFGAVDKILNQNASDEVRAALNRLRDGLAKTDGKETSGRRRRSKRRRRGGGRRS